MGKILYRLVITGPNEVDTTRFESEYPFFPINKGDLINPRMWETVYEGELWRVKSVEHFIYKTDDALHQDITVYTTLEDDTLETRYR